MPRLSPAVLFALLVPAAAGPVPYPDAATQRRHDFCQQPPQPLQVVRSRKAITGPSVLRDRRRRAAVRRLLRETGTDARAIARQVQSGPIVTRTIYTRAGPYTWYYACQRHNCNGNELDVVHDPRSGTAFGLHYQDPVRWWEYRLGKPGATYLGHPDRQQRALLKSLLCTRYDGTRY